MKEHQLIGKKRILVRSKRRVQYSSSHILSLPYEIWLEIFKNFEDDVKTLLSLCLVCSRFQTIVSKHLLYKRIRFENPKIFLHFASAHLPVSNSLVRKLGLSEPSSKINFIESVQFVNPPSKESANSKLSIVGSYNVDSIDMRSSLNLYNDFSASFGSLLKESYGLKSISLWELSPSFEFSESLMESNLISNQWKARGPVRTLRSLTLKAQSGWSIPLKIPHLSTILNVFNVVEELILHNFIIDDSNLAFSSKSQKKLHIKKLSVFSCKYKGPFRSSGSKKQPSELFANTLALNLVDLSSGSDLSIIDYIKLNRRLCELTIDLNSSMFFISENNRTKFNFNKYNSFFELLCSGKGSFSTINHLNLRNFGLFEYSEARHDALEHKSPLDEFWQCVAPISNLTLQLKEAPQRVKVCAKCGFSKNDEDKQLESLNPKEWQVLLNPLLSKNENANIHISTHEGRPLFIRSKDT